MRIGDLNMTATVLPIRNGLGLIYCYTVTGSTNPLASSRFDVSQSKDRERARRTAYRQACKLRDRLNCRKTQ
jgi:hypothetical protein